MSQQLIGKPAEGGTEAEGWRPLLRRVGVVMKYGGLKRWKALQGQQRKREPKHCGEQQEQCAQ